MNLLITRTYTGKEEISIVIDKICFFSPASEDRTMICLGAGEDNFVTVSESYESIKAKLTAQPAQPAQPAQSVARRSSYPDPDLTKYVSEYKECSQHHHKLFTPLGVVDYWPTTGKWACQQRLMKGETKAGLIDFFEQLF